jgi:feruloyl esterase
MLDRFSRETGMRWIIVALTLLAALAGLAPVAAQTAPAGAGPVDERCSKLVRTDFSRIPDAPTAITAATSVAAAADVPAYCRVEGYIAPQVGFEVHLPLAGWNGKYLQQGCGGMCGGINMGACQDALARNYAVANTDMGHKGPPFTVKWAKDNRNAEIDFAYRATHVLAVAAKAIINAYYGQAPRYSYFRGCSTGGRQALIEAQSFPADFDGIIAGAPVIDETGDGLLHLLWSGRAALDQTGQPVLFADKVELVRNAVLAACDGLDGVKDGILQDPRRCNWKPSALACRGSDASGCLGPAEIAAVERMYAGAHDSRGRRLFSGGMPLGSEYQWAPAFVNKPDQLPMVLDPNGMMPDFMRYLSFWYDLPEDTSLMSFDWDRDPQRLGLVERLFYAGNPDLRRFKERGGKLILYHGWDDLEIPAALSIDYYQLVERTMGGAAATRDFFRFFIIPGMAHCRRGVGADAIDTLSALEAWVERNEAPDQLLAHHLIKEQSYLGLPALRYPLDRASYDWTRPVPAWPKVARWTGRGDWKEAKNWTAR